MNDLRTAAQQALEALEMSRRFVYADNRPQCDDAITALRTALENEFNPDWDQIEPLQESLREHMAEIQRLRAALAEPVQEPVEPVAKVELMTTGGNAGLATRIVEIDDHLRDRLRPGQLLYAVPPQRKPLTEEKPWVCACGANLYIDENGAPRSKA